VGKQTKWIIAAALGVAVLGGVAFWLSQTPTTEEKNAAREEDITLADRTRQEITAVRVVTTQGEYTAENVGEGSFEISDLEGIPVNATQLDLLLDCAAAPKASRVVEEAPSDLTKFGLDVPVARVEVSYSQGDPLILLLGSDAPHSAGVYCKREGDAAVYLMDTARAQELSQPLNQLVDRVLGENIPTNEVGRVTLSGSGFPQDIVLEPTTEESSVQKYGAETHRMTEPKDRAADSDAVSDIITTAMGLTAAEAAVLNPTSEEMAETGLEKPAAILTMEYGEGETLTLRAGDTDEDGMVWVMKDGVPVLYRVTLDSCPWVTASYETLASRQLVSPSLEELSEISVTTAGEGFTFLISGEEGDVQVSCNGQELDPEAFQEYFQSIIAMKGEAFTQQRPGGSPEVTLTYTYRDVSKNPTVIQLTPNGEGYLVTVNGETELTVSENIPALLLENTRKAAQSLKETQ